MSTYAIDEIGVYFSDSSNDTIKYCNTPITYLNPQIKTASSVYVSDTLNWVEYHGLYTANGNEMYIVIGNFRDNPNTDTLFVGPTAASPEIFAAYCLDDISLINIDLPAYAGRDTTVLPGSSVFLGRESDVGIDEACVWYKLPDLTNSLDTIAGFSINPTITTTYVVRQELTCSNAPKWDTVVVTVDPTVGIKKLTSNSNLYLFPSPAGNYIDIGLQKEDMKDSFLRINIYDNLGQYMKEEEVTLIEKKARIDVSNLPNGSYLIKVTNSKSESITKKLLISR